MNFADWIPAITASAVMSTCGVLLGVAAKASIEKGIQHGLDRELEAIRSQLRSDEERLKAELRSRDDQIDSLKSTALSGLAASQAALSQRRAQAAERLWSAVIDLAQFKVASMSVGMLHLDKVFEVAAGGGRDSDKMKLFAKTMLEAAGIKDGKFVNPIERVDKDRPFIDTYTWALFSAYRQLLTSPVMILIMIAHGQERNMLRDEATLLKPIRAALPEYEKYIDEFGIGGISHLVEPLEAKLLVTLVANLEGSGADHAAVQRAGEILKAVKEAAENLTPQPLPAGLEGMTA